MKYTVKKTVSVVLLAIALLAVAVLFYKLNEITPLYKDDYSYSYTFAVKENKFRIESFDEVIASQINHYKVMNGRAVSHTLAQTFLMYGKSVFNLINTLAFAVLCYLCAVHGTGRRSVSFIYPLIAFSVLWFATPAFGQSFLWLTGACNYLWGIFIILLFLTPLTLAYNGTKGMSITTKIILVPIYFVFGIVAGNTNENTSAALMVVSFLYIVFLTFKYKKFPFWTLSGFFGNIAGFLMLILAPGQQTRLDSNGGFGSLGVWLDRFKNISVMLYEKLGILVGIILLLWIVGFIRKRYFINIIPSLIFFVGGLASVYSMILSPYFPDRVWSGPCVFFAVSLIGAFEFAFDGYKFSVSAATSAVLAVIIIISIGYTYPKAYTALNTTYNAVCDREEAITLSKREGRSEVELESIYGYSKYDPYDKYGDLNDDPTTWPNTALAMYFGLDEVRKK